MNAPVTPLSPKNAENAPLFDLFVVGGGINGVGIANDAVGRGLSVAVCEQNDFASATSSASSKLIHGGLRYLEHYEFRLVKEALAEREVLLTKAPHLIKPMRFILPHRPHLRPAWMIRIGLFLYDHLSSRAKLPGSRGLHLDPESADNPLNSSIRFGFEYSDCWVDDARLVVLNAMQAREQGAQLMTRTRCQSAYRKNGLWHVAVENIDSGQVQYFRARSLVNAAGPWAQKFIEDGLKTKSPRNIRLIKGSHFVVPRIHDGEQAYILQNEDQRIVFVIPYNQYFSVVGTTDKEYKGDPAKVAMDDEEEAYLLDIVNKHFKRQLNSADIVWRYSGVRPLCDDESDSPSAITRDYTLEVQADENQQAPILSVFGGKITTYRKLAESALHALKPFFPAMGDSWTAKGTLPGGDIEGSDFEHWLVQLAREFPWVPAGMLRRMANAYGTRIVAVLGDARQIAELGQPVGSDLYESEVKYLVTQEWARTADDILWRRSKLGLFVNAEGKAALTQLLEEKMAGWLADNANAASANAEATAQARNAS